ncbi:hypothetical protein JQC91_08005 [Jannaschia sp. Os4]|uniref:hypothetical protein n=1 Tax=Jannaschia sp. Os4 TaxID=2807617 RepID=UPI001939B1A3|nr:hypothetical protein [Jannaschia sp. Os4]MBM2576247.1 hypothetical protein [Jannaschia sp. Os4]
MKTTALAATALAVLASASVAPTPADAWGNRAMPEPREIRISCDRSLLKNKVVFDRAMGVFLDDLASLGYSNAEAVAIGERVCRDERLVGNPEAMAAQVRNIIRTQPPCNCNRARARRHH